MSDAKKTIESSILMALADTALDSGLTADKCRGLAPQILERIFENSVRWSIEDYLRELKENDEQFQDKHRD